MTKRTDAWVKNDELTSRDKPIIIPLDTLMELLVRYLKQPRDKKSQERDMWWAQKLQNHNLENPKDPRQ